MSKPKVIPIIHDVEWAQELERGFAEYQETLYEHLEWEDGEPEPEATLSGEPFCGCDTCQIREQLFFLVPAVIQGYLAGKLGIKVAE